MVEADEGIFSESFTNLKSDFGFLTQWAGTDDKKRRIIIYN